MAVEGDDIVGRVRSVNAVGATWCADMYVEPSQRRRGIGKALMVRGSRCSVLMATHAGALLYPSMGYERIGMLLIFGPRSRTSS
ncbi:GNAT family N-acetyltransferase [Mesorhizobium sp. B2-4-17]|uniref:GNAT family N-acetyltransferase n=1 Tax=Mesorhizobium sp. B2-4-17 TaxID=2589932 RepID=UPI001FED7849|nr:GNAT family N-acetyltransferase [Mesorhizobium sp. B2-4-17]